jgi:hypothetical protein
MIVSLKAIALSLCLVGGLAVSTASALPLAKSGEVSKASGGVVLADYKKNYKGDFKKCPPGKFYYTPGSRHSKPPKYWHRYGKRPGNWRTRGCIIVGPVWFCP